MNRYAPGILITSLAVIATAVLTSRTARSAESADLAAQGERHLRNIRQLTFGGENAEAYFSFDGKKLIFQSTRDGYPADQIYVMNADGSNVHRVSTGKGRCTCSYFLKGDRRILYASTHLADEKPPQPPDRSHGYVWAIYPGYDIFTARPDGSDLRRLTDTPGYDAEATVSPDGRRVVFTSMRDGDLELYTMSPDGRGVRRLTHTLGYDGGAFFSPDSRRICFRAERPTTAAGIEEYKTLLKQGLVHPRNLELYVMNADGTGERQVTHNGAANFCPFFTRDGRRLIFSSNMNDPQGREFDLYLVNVDGTGLERVTTAPQFDGFPMFSPDGKKLAWASNRNSKVRGETNIFIADWME
jgi:TolB protein